MTSMMIHDVRGIFFNEVIELECQGCPFFSRHLIINTDDGNFDIAVISNVAKNLSILCRTEEKI